MHEAGKNTSGVQLQVDHEIQRMCIVVVLRTVAQIHEALHEAAPEAWIGNCTVANIELGDMLFRSACTSGVRLQDTQLAIIVYRMSEEQDKMQKLHLPQASEHNCDSNAISDVGCKRTVGASETQRSESSHIACQTRFACVQDV